MITWAVPAEDDLPALPLPPELVPALVPVLPAVAGLSVLSELPPHDTVSAPAIVKTPRAKRPVFVFMLLNLLSGIRERIVVQERHRQATKLFSREKFRGCVPSRARRA